MQNLHIAFESKLERTHMLEILWNLKIYKLLKIISVYNADWSSWISSKSQWYREIFYINAEYFRIIIIRIITTEIFTFLSIALSSKKNMYENLSKFIIFDGPIPRTSSGEQEISFPGQKYRIARSEEQVENDIWSGRRNNVISFLHDFHLLFP